MGKVMFEQGLQLVRGASSIKNCSKPFRFHTKAELTKCDRYIREFGVDDNLFVDHSQIMQLAGLRVGIWSKTDTFGKITMFRPDGAS